jgi:hydrocephalus-inducing protein
LANLDGSKVRWVIPAKKTLILLVKFFTETTGKFEAKLEFESFFSTKTYSLQVTGLSDFPQISSLPKNIFYSQKKNRPPTAPECFLHRTFVVSENCFDFGPSVIGKDPQQKT